MLSSLTKETEPIRDEFVFMVWFYHACASRSTLMRWILALAMG